jgi:hypothetical protein
VNITIHENYQTAGLVGISVLFYFGKIKAEGLRDKRQAAKIKKKNPAIASGGQ